MNLIFFCFLSLFSSLGYADEAPSLAEVKFVQGEASFGRTRPLRVGMKLQSGEVVSTESRSFVRILFESGIALHVGPNSSIRIEQRMQKPTQIELIRGQLLSVIRKEATERKTPKYELRTKIASMGVRGTTFFAS
jgi:hypothetical protein